MAVLTVSVPDVVADALRVAGLAPIDSICPSGEAWGWTRKRSGVPIKAAIETPDGKFSSVTVQATRAEVLIEERGWRFQRVRKTAR